MHARRPFAVIRLLLRYFDTGTGIFPVHVQGALAAALVESDGEVLDRRAGFGNAHRHARQSCAVTGIVGSPLARLFADNQRPLVGFGDGEDSVAAGWNILSTDDYRAVGNKRSG